MNENQSTGTSDTESLYITLGDDYSCFKNDGLSKWYKSLKDPDNWEIIEYEKVSSIFELLPQRYFQSIQALMVKNTTNNVTEINPLDKVLSYWTNKLCHGLTITEKALECSNFKAFDASLEKPKELNNSKSSLTTSKTTLCSFLLENNIENSDEMINFFDKVPFVSSETKESWSPQSENEFVQVDQRMRMEPRLKKYQEEQVKGTVEATKKVLQEASTYLAIVEKYARLGLQFKQADP